MFNFWAIIPFQIQHMIFRFEFQNRLHRYFLKLVQLFMIVGHFYMLNLFSWWYINSCRIALFQAPPDLTPPGTCLHSPAATVPFGRHACVNQLVWKSCWACQTTNICGQFAICFLQIQPKNMDCTCIQNRTIKPIYRANSPKKMHHVI